MFFSLTCHIHSTSWTAKPLTRRWRAPTALSPGRRPPSYSGARPPPARRAGPRTHWPASPRALRSRRAVSPETRRPYPIGRRRPSPVAGLIFCRPVREAPGSRRILGRGCSTDRERRLPVRAWKGHWSCEVSGACSKPGAGRAAGATGPRAYLGQDDSAAAIRGERSRARLRRGRLLREPRNGGQRREPTRR